MVRSTRRTAVVVGAGPNGLTAAARLAVDGWRVRLFEAAPTVGGGSRTTPFTDNSVVDFCAAVHPFGAGSPAFDQLGLNQLGLEWAHAPIALAHPFIDGGAATLHHDLATTVVGLTSDGERWRRLIGAFATDWPRLRHLVLGPVPKGFLAHPLQMARFGIEASLPAMAFARLFRGREARALVGGLAAHTGERLSRPASAGVAIALAAAAHAVGMPVARGGSQHIADALAAIVGSNGGEIECNRVITSISQLPAADAVLLDLTPLQVATVLGRSAPRWHHGVGAWKLDLLLSEPMPWLAAACREAGTVHLGGEIADIASAERATVRGAVVDEPFVIVAQPTVADPSRAASDEHVVWAYRHVPNGCADATATAGIERQFDRFAPGWRDVVLHRRVTTASGFASYNANYIGGDVAGGAMTPWQTVARPRLALDPYRTGVPGVWICSQSTPPGPGVHGMCGWHAAGSVLAASLRRRAALA
jgi:phytoene dehydrogenase-like protein